MKNPMTLVVHYKKHCKKKLSISNEIGLRSPIIQEKKWSKNVTCIVACVSHTHIYTHIIYAIIYRLYMQRGSKWPQCLITRTKTVGAESTRHGWMDISKPSGTPQSSVGVEAMWCVGFGIRNREVKGTT